VEKVTAVVGSRFRLCKLGLQVLGQKLKIRAIVARFRSASRLQEVEGGSVVS